MNYEEKWFYTAEPKREKVDKETFKNFIKNYPRKLERDVYAVYDPPLITYNDFELANRWPHSVVAFTYGYEDNPGDYFYMPEEKRTYCIVTNYEELFKSKTGNKA